VTNDYLFLIVQLVDWMLHCSIIFSYHEFGCNTFSEMSCKTYYTLQFNNV